LVGSYVFSNAAIRIGLDAGPGVFSFFMTKIERYVLGIAGLAASASALVYTQTPAFSVPYLRVALVFGAIGLLARLLRHRIGQASSGSLAFIPMLASAIMAPHWITVAGVATIVAVDQLVVRNDWKKLTFNVGQYSFAIAIAILVYRAGGGVALTKIGDASAAAFIASFAIFLLINSVCVSWAIAIVTEDDFVDLWKKSTLGDLPYDFLALPVILFFVWIYTNFGAVGALFLTVPLLGMRQLSLLNSKLEQTNRELLDVMIAAIEARDPYTSGHSRRVAANARIIGRAIGLKSRDVERISVAALLHDVGKIHEVFGPILSKPGRLTPEENAIMKTHPIKSEELAATVSELTDVLPMIRHHHENWDGSGYPDGLAADAIPVGSRVIMFADTIDAMTTDRPYRAALGEAAVRKELEKFKGIQFDPVIYDRLVNSVDFRLLFRPQELSLAPLPIETLRKVSSLA
jgi:HD-GYP domain-containing protein (c-di-GMP phosphodiesterase class II)